MFANSIEFGIMFARNAVKRAVRLRPLGDP